MIKGLLRVRESYAKYVLLYSCDASCSHSGQAVPSDVKDVQHICQTTSAETTTKAARGAASTEVK